MLSTTSLFLAAIVLQHAKMARGSPKNPSFRLYYTPLAQTAPTDSPVTHLALSVLPRHATRGSSTSRRWYAHLKLRRCARLGRGPRADARICGHGSLQLSATVSSVSLATTMIKALTRSLPNARSTSTDPPYSIYGRSILPLLIRTCLSRPIRSEHSPHLPTGIWRPGTFAAVHDCPR